MITAAYSDVGSVRKVNEDSYYVSDFKNNNGYIIVADGMGGHKGGQTASKTAIDEIINTLNIDSILNLNDEEIEKKLTECIKNANSAIFSRALADDSLSGMGTTVVLCVIINGIAYIANVGDSRLYAIRDNRIAQVTKDHSVVQMLIDNGEITENQAKNHPNKNVITRAVGSNAKVETDIYKYCLNEGDYILMCTDGLSNMVDSNSILNLIINEESLRDAVDKLGKLANQNGGLDNITLVALKC